MPERISDIPVGCVNRKKKFYVPILSSHEWQKRLTKNTHIMNWYRISWEENLRLILTQSERTSFFSAIVHWPQLYSLAKHVRFCEPGVVTFSRRHF